jgi:hypothetical protein
VRDEGTKDGIPNANPMFSWLHKLVSSPKEEPVPPPRPSPALAALLATPEEDAAGSPTRATTASPGAVHPSPPTDKPPPTKKALCASGCCPAGKFALRTNPTNKPICMICPGGKFQPVPTTTATSCSDCLPGFFQHRYMQVILDASS